MEPLELPMMSDIEASATPEEHLWRSVLIRAFHDALSEPVSDEGRKLRDSAREWFHEADENFRLVCVFAGYHPAFVHRCALDLMAKSGRHDKTRSLIGRPFSQRGTQESAKYQAA
ncbi:MAG: hypothetical protein HQL57_06140 [Magnetococcales bacterium]|nr:hypothetical protein [Magnetococcales bacterium]MBF0156748.1 hypothetical protein [Magnetococcales bacterium]